MELELNSIEVKCTKDHCVYCFDTIIDFLHNTEHFKASDLPDVIPRIKSPLFVTWHIYKDELRGCIGTFQHLNIEKSLSMYALYSAFKDSRFEPISIKELPHLQCSVSLLVNFQKTQNPFGWEIGKHGINIEFQDKNGNEYKATFLPEIPIEQGWDQETTLQYLVRKAGYKEINWKEILSSMTVQTYESSKVMLSFDEYREIRGGNQAIQE